MNTAHQSNLLPTPPAGFYRATEASKLLGISRSTFWLWVSNKTLNGVKVPQPIKLTAGITVWVREDIHGFIEALAAKGPHKL